MSIGIKRDPTNIQCSVAASSKCLHATQFALPSLPPHLRASTCTHILAQENYILGFNVKLFAFFVSNPVKYVSCAFDVFVTTPLAVLVTSIISSFSFFISEFADALAVVLTALLTVCGWPIACLHALLVRGRGMAIECDGL